MLQLDFLCDILKKCRENGIHTAVDTAGNVPWQSFLKIMPYTDLFLFDVKCFSEQLHIEGTGVSNKLLLENLKKLSENFKGEIIIRVPVIGGYNDSEEEIEKICDFLKTVKVKKTELLPYHEMGEHKYDALGMKCEKYGVPDMKEITEIFEELL